MNLGERDQWILRISTKTCPCNIQRIFSAEEKENHSKNLIILIFLLKTLIVGAC